MKVIFLARAEHYHIDGQHLSAHSSRAGAVAAVIPFLQITVDDTHELYDLNRENPTGLPPKVTTRNWSSVVEKLEEIHGARYDYGSVTELELKP